MITGLEQLSYEESSRQGCLTWKREDVKATFQYINKNGKKQGEKFLRRESCNTSSNDFKLKEGRYGLDIINKFFTMRVEKLQKMLPQRGGECSTSGNIHG